MIGPAMATMAMSRCRLWSLSMTTGTGLAPPKIILGVPRIAGRTNQSSTGSAIVMTGSMCRIGFGVMRPSFFAVSSPRQ